MLDVRRAVFALIAAFAACLMGVSTVAAATRYQDSVSGAEVYATSTEGIFAGTASGDLPGYWSADIIHTPLSGSPQTATIQSGQFDLATNLHNQTVLVIGTFSGGSVVQTAGFSGCVNQVYAVNGQLDSVGIYGRPDHGTGAFTATLTHYRYPLDGHCITYAASISGTVSLDF